MGFIITAEHCVSTRRENRTSLNNENDFIKMIVIYYYNRTHFCFSNSADAH